MAKKGGPQPGSGRPKGRLNDSTLKKIAVRRYWLNRLAKDQVKLYDAQIAQACGTKFLVVRDKASGKFTPVSEAQAKMLASSDSEDVVEVWERPPSTQAFIALADRALDKPTEHTEITGAENGPLVIKWQE
jgi:hypothetical protein